MYADAFAFSQGCRFYPCDLIVERSSQIMLAPPPFPPPPLPPSPTTTTTDARSPSGARSSPRFARRCPGWTVAGCPW
eukprot:1458130-Pyramimonas_sp.AAC.1